jgi:predicted nucleic acid-binding protein
MATVPTSSPPSVTLDASFIVGYCAKEPGRYIKAQAELSRYASNGWELFAPGVAVAETLFVLCKKLQDGDLTVAEHADAVLAFYTLMQTVQPPPCTEFALIARAEQIRATYGCSRSADAIYLALTETLTALGTAEIVTFDSGMENQAKKNAPTATVNCLPP